MILYPVFQYLKENEDITKQFKTQSEDHEDEMNGILPRIRSYSSREAFTC